MPFKKIVKSMESMKMVINLTLQLLKNICIQNMEKSTILILKSIANLRKLRLIL